MSEFKLVSPFKPMGDQVQAIQELVEGLKAGKEGTSSFRRNWYRKDFYSCQCH